MQRLRDAFRYAWAGIVVTVKTQPNMRLHLVFAVFALVASALLRLAVLEWAVIIVLIGTVLALECLNTAVESALDRMGVEEHPLARRAKDAAAGAVLVAAATAACVGSVIFVHAALRMASS
ncbi:MAG: diacylglycerol kinase family protein [Coriobacteriales bacterium]|jgi:diacylglycerol kinase|nr:diacylglycerol kinase family protein [Coriobacteriales bacterium]